MYEDKEGRGGAAVLRDDKERDSTIGLQVEIHCALGKYGSFRAVILGWGPRIGGRQ